MALNPKPIAFISVIFVLIVLIDYICKSSSFFWGGGHVSAGFCLWVLLRRLPHVFMLILFTSLFSNFLFVFCDLMYLINLI